MFFFIIDIGVFWGGFLLMYAVVLISIFLEVNTGCLFSFACFEENEVLFVCLFVCLFVVFLLLVFFLKYISLFLYLFID